MPSFPLQRCLGLMEGLGITRDRRAVVENTPIPRPYSLHPAAEPDYTQLMTHYARTPIPRDFISETRLTSVTKRPQALRVLPGTVDGQCRRSLSTRPTRPTRRPNSCGERVPLTVSVDATNAPSKVKEALPSLWGWGLGWGCSEGKIATDGQCRRSVSTRPTRPYSRLISSYICYSGAMDSKSLSFTCNHDLSFSLPGPYRLARHPYPPRSIHTVSIYRCFLWVLSGAY